jgi:hypothetical protein
LDDGGNSPATRRGLGTIQTDEMKDQSELQARSDTAKALNFLCGLLFLSTLMRMQYVAAGTWRECACRRSIPIVRSFLKVEPRAIKG